MAMGTTGLGMGVMRDDMDASEHRMTGPRGSQPMELQVMMRMGMSTVVVARL